MAVEGTDFGPGGAEADLAELARLADDLVAQISATRQHYDDLKAALDGTEVPRDDAPSRLDEAHLVALSMALTGGTREDARAHLAEAFGLDEDDADGILDDAFGVRFDDVSPAPAPRRRFARLRRDRVRGEA